MQLTFQPHQEVRSVCKVKVFASMLVYTSFPLIWLLWNMTTLRKKSFDQIWPAPWVEVVCKDELDHAVDGAPMQFTTLKFLTPINDTTPQCPRGHGQKSTVAHSIHVSNSYTQTETKFGWILFNGLWGNSIMDRRTEG